MTTIQINITKDILKKSMMCGHNLQTKGKSSSNCAIALAIRDLFPKAEVGLTMIFFNGFIMEENISITSYLPKKAIDFIKFFDSILPENRIKMDEFSFEIEVPDAIINEIGIDEIHRVLKNCETMSLV